MSDPEPTDPLDPAHPAFGDFYDELPLWSAPFGLALLERVAFGAATTPWTAGTNRLCKKVGALGLDNVVVLTQGAEELTLDADSIDVIVSNLGVNNFDDADAVLRVLFRVAKPGAALLITTNLEGHMAEFYDIFRTTLIETGQQDRLGALDEHIRHRGTRESVERDIRNAGFTVREVTTDSFRMRFADGRSLLRHHLIRLGFLGSWKPIAAPGAEATTFQALERNLDEFAARHGELALTIPMALFEATK